MAAPASHPTGWQQALSFVGMGATVGVVGGLVSGITGTLVTGAALAAAVTAVVAVAVGVSISLAMVAEIDNPGTETVWDDPIAPLETPPVSLPPATQPPWIPTPPPGTYAPPVIWPTGSVWPDFNAGRAFTPGLRAPSSSMFPIVHLPSAVEEVSAAAHRPGGLYVSASGSALGTVSSLVSPQPGAVFSFTADPATVGLVSIAFDNTVGEAGAWKGTCSQDPQLTWYSLALAGEYLCYSEGSQDVENLGFTLAVQ